MDRLLPNEKLVAEECQEEVRTAMQEVIDEALDILDSRGLTYDQHEPMWHRMQMGEVAFAVMVGLKARRAGAVLTAPAEVAQPEKVDDILLDLLNYTLMWAALRKVRVKQMAALVVSEEPQPGAVAAPARQPLRMRRPGE